MEMKNILRKRNLVFCTAILLVNAFFLQVLTADVIIPTYSEEDKINSEPTSKELVLLLVKADSNWQKDEEGIYSGFDFESAKESLTAEELDYIRILDTSLSKIFTSARAGEKILELKLELYPWTILFSDMKEKGLESILLELEDELGIQPSNNVSSTIRMSVKRIAYCNWWEIPWGCFCGGGWIRDHPCPLWVTRTRAFSSFASAKSYVEGLGYHKTAGYACDYGDNDFTKVVDKYGCGWGPIRSHCRIDKLGSYYYYKIQDDCSGISHCEPGEPNPEILSWWIALCPVWWSAYVINWHDEVC